ncbi:MAG: energy transducer TonB [Pseudomonadota bacterium]
MSELTIQPARFRGEERIGLLVALALHVGVVALLLFQPVRDELVAIPERMTVSLASEVSLESTAPDPVAESRAAIAPEPSDEQAPPAEEQQLQAQPDPTRAAPDAPPTSRPTSRPTPTAASGGSSDLIGSDFLEGAGSSRETDAIGSEGARFGPQQKAALEAAITRELRPHWRPPSGADADKLVSIIAWKLNKDGTLNGRPRLVNQTGVNASNRPQANIHAERAIRAVQSAAPFGLPERFYSEWDDLVWNFDYRL